MVTALASPPPADAAPPEPETLAEIIDGLGVSSARIRWNPRPGTATEEDIFAVRAQFDRICELVDGILVEKGMSYRACLLESYLVEVINQFVRAGNLGLVTGESGLLRLMAGLVRIPDVAFVAWARVPGGVVPDAPVPGLVPNLAVEVLRPSNTAKEMARKRSEYFQAGVELVWIIDPATRTAECFTGVDRSTLLDESQPLDGGTVLPGFRLPLAELFAELDRRPAWLTAIPAPCTRRGRHAESQLGHSPDHGSGANGTVTVTSRRSSSRMYQSVNGGTLPIQRQSGFSSKSRRGSPNCG